MGEEKEVEEMKAWEQHSWIISIPRYDYKAPSSLLINSHSAFLITCPIKREKSATKEAIAIFEKLGISTNMKYAELSKSFGNAIINCHLSWDMILQVVQIITLYFSGASECIENSDAIVAAKKRKVCGAEIDVNCSVSERNNVANSVETDEESCSPTSKSDKESDTRYKLSLVKLTRSGLLLFTVPKNDFPDVLDVVSNIFRALELGLLSSPLWCHRIFPIQATCCLNEKELQTVLSKLLLQFLKDYQDKLQRPIKFAIGYNRRGVEEKELKTSRKSTTDSGEIALLDRNICFSVVAATIKDIIPHSVADLKSPELSVLVEVLPLSGIPNGSLVVGVAVLPHNLVATKPKLTIKSLLSDSKIKNGKQK